MEDLETPTESHNPEPEASPISEEPALPASDAAAGEYAAIPEPAQPDLRAPRVVAMDEVITMDELITMDQRLSGEQSGSMPLEDAQIRAVLEAIIYVAEEPLTPAQMAAALELPADRIRAILEQLIAEFDKPEHGVTIREVAGGYKMATKPEHHDAVRSFVKSLKPPLKLSLPALETLAVIAYKQPVTTPEIMEIRGVQGGGVLKTLLDRKLIAEAGRKNVIGKPILFKTTKEFLIQFGLKDLSELPSLKEFEEIRRMALSDAELPAVEATPEAAGEAAAEPAPETHAPAPVAADSETPAPDAPSQDREE